MPRYANGRIPLDTLVQFDTGGGAHMGTVGTRDKWYTLRRNVQQKYGKTLAITPGWNVYRPFDQQVIGRNNACRQGNCNAAAVAGSSSHGGVWGGQDTLALDIGNYGIIGRDAFFAEARAAGFAPGLINRAVAGIDEPWHIIDFEPYRAVPSGGGSTPYPSAIDTESGEMREYYRHGDIGAIVVITGGEMIPLDERNARKLLDIDRINHQRNPQVYAKPPVFDDPKSFFNIDQQAWDLLAAVYKFRKS